MNAFDYEKIWQGTWGDMQKFGPVHRHHRRIFSEIFKKLPEKDIQSIADIGCGEGSNLHFLKSQFPKANLFGFDISNTAIETAKTYIDAKFSLLNIQSEIPSQKFDLVFCSDVVEHLEDDVSAIKNIRQITNGYTLIATVQGQMRPNEKSIGHIRNYKYGELRRKVEEANFEVLQVIEWGYPFYSPLFRDLINIYPASEKFSQGKYGAMQKIAAHVLYSLFCLNRSNRGDVIFILARP